MPEIEDILNELEGPPAPDTVPEPPPDRRGWLYCAGASFALLGLFAGLAVVGIGNDRHSGLRGEIGEIQVDLRMIVERSSGLTRVTPQATYYIGETVWFRAGATPEADLVLRVESPQGVINLAEFHATPHPEDVRNGAETVGWRFDAPGRYSFVLTTTDTASAMASTGLDADQAEAQALCVAPECQRIVLEVR
jgi:hypothetical protein